MVRENGIHLVFIALGFALTVPAFYQGLIPILGWRLVPEMANGYEWGARQPSFLLLPTISLFHLSTDGSIVSSGESCVVSDLSLLRVSTWALGNHIFFLV